MATFPTYALMLLEGASESFDSGVIVSEMERGLAKQRVTSNRVLRKLKVTLEFSTAADATAFENWYFVTIKRINFFDVQHPRTGQTVAMRFEKGEIGELIPKRGLFTASTRAVVLEYLQ